MSNGKEELIHAKTGMGLRSMRLRESSQTQRDAIECIYMKCCTKQNYDKRSSRRSQGARWQEGTGCKDTSKNFGNARNVLHHDRGGGYTLRVLPMLIELYF